MEREADTWRAPILPSRTRQVDVRGCRLNVREGGRVGAPPVLLLHGGRDASATFQFLVDATEGDWHFVAPDWRGHGLSGWTPGNYWLSDFLADLDALSASLFGGDAVAVVGHSMGANVAGMFAGLRPGRVSRLVLLDALGNMLDLTPVPVVDTLLRLLAPPRAVSGARVYPTVAKVAARLQAANRRLGGAQAAFMATQLSRPVPDGFTWAKDPSFERSFPTLHDDAEWGSCWSRITAPVLCLFSSDPRTNAVTGDPLRVRSRAAHFRDIELATVPDTGHNLHHDAPRSVAHAVEAFLTDRAPLVRQR